MNAPTFPRSNDLREGGRWTRAQRVKNGCIYAIIIVVLWLVRISPRRLVGAGFTLVGGALYLVAGSLRRNVRRRLTAGLGRPGREREVARAFIRVGSLLADTLALLSPDEQPSRTMVMSAAAAGVFADALKEGRGVVYMTAHWGPWERMAARLVEAGFPVAAVARESYDPRITQLYDRLRGARGVRSIYRGRPGSSFAIARELVEGRAVGFLVDLPTRVPSVRVDLFGASSSLPVGPATIALRRRAAVLVGCPRRLATGDHEIVLCRLDAGDLLPTEAGARELTQRVADALSIHIRADPAAWLGLFMGRDAS